MNWRAIIACPFRTRVLKFGIWNLKLVSRRDIPSVARQPAGAGIGAEIFKYRQA